MEYRDLLSKRRCMRKFSGDNIPKEHLRAILESGLRAPNACNFQSWHFYCICDKEKIAGLVPDICRWDWVKDAAAVIVICTKSAKLEERFGDRGAMFAIQDTAAAAENILLASADFGYGGCWIGAFNEDACRAYLALPEEHRPVIILPIGTVEEEPPLRERNSFENAVTFVGEPEDTLEAAEPNFSLCDASLPHAVFDNLYLGGASFHNICLTDATFADINFTGTGFGGLCMNKTSFGCVDMVDADYRNVDLTEAHFTNCTFKNTVLENCSVEGLIINGVDITEQMKQKQ